MDGWPKQRSYEKSIKAAYFKDIHSKETRSAKENPGLGSRPSPETQSDILRALDNCPEFEAINERSLESEFSDAIDGYWGEPPTLTCSS